VQAQDARLPTEIFPAAVSVAGQRGGRGLLSVTRAAIIRPSIADVAVFQVRIHDPLVSSLHFAPDFGQGIGGLVTLAIPKAARIRLARRERQKTPGEEPRASLGVGAVG